MAEAITGALCVIPSCLQVGEAFDLKLKLLGAIHPIPCRNGWRTVKPGLGSPYNLSVERRIQYLDNCPAQWTGELAVLPQAALAGPARLVFDGTQQGVFDGDTRPIAHFSGFSFTQPGVHFVEMIEPVSGRRISSNPVWVTADQPARRLYWGDPHWHTIFTDGLRCPEELYAFARDEAFLDFGMLTDHMEGLTARQWDYQVAVTNDYNQAGRFATLVAQEWTSMKYGHRNLYFRDDHATARSSLDPRFDTLQKLWDSLADSEVVVIPHHSANVTMGVDWSHGWHPELERAVEIHSVWGCSERPASAGNPLPIQVMKGEKPGQHVLDALRRGYRLNFVGGGDIHDGRPGDELHSQQVNTGEYPGLRPQGFTGLWAPTLARETVYDSLRAGATYATVRSRILLDAQPRQLGTGLEIAVLAASEHGIHMVELVHNGQTVATMTPGADARLAQGTMIATAAKAGDFCFVRVTTAQGQLAWSSPHWPTA
jgi:hypothetical protein